MSFLLYGLGFVVAAVLAVVIIQKRKDRDIPGYLRVPKVKGILPVLNFLDEIFGLFGLQLIKFRRDQWIKEAQDIASYPGAEAVFGDQSEFLEGMTLFLKEVRDDLMNASGKILHNGFFMRVLNARRSVVKYCVEHPEITESKIVRPIIITGLGRTGSTLLYNLMACDPKARTPRFYEMCHMSEPAPPVASAAELDTDPRIQQVQHRFDVTEKNYPNLFQEAGKSHRSHPAEIEEDLLILFQAAIFQLHIPLTLGKKRRNLYREWFCSNEKPAAYRYHKRFLQMMNSKFQPESHWLLKAPMHCTYMDSLTKEYPDARIVFTHRDPLAVNPSWVKLMESYIGWDYRDNVCDRKFFASHFKEAHELQVQRMIEWKKHANKEQYFELNYDTMIKDPVAAVAAIYEHFGLECDDEFKARMRQWHADNRQGKYGRAPYSLEEYGFTEEQTRADFKDYYDQCLAVAY